MITWDALASSWPGPPRVNRRQDAATLVAGRAASCLTMATLTRLDEAKACLFENAERYACFRAKLLALAELVLPALQLVREAASKRLPRPARAPSQSALGWLPRGSVDSITNLVSSIQLGSQSLLNHISHQISHVPQCAIALCLQGPGQAVQGSLSLACPGPKLIFLL